MSGVKDLLYEPDSIYTLVARCQSSDKRFEYTAIASAYTADVTFPSVEKLLPITSSLVGQQITITAAAFVDARNISVAVGGVEVSQQKVLRTLLRNTTTGIWAITTDHDYKFHKYVDDNHIGHNYIRHDYIGHNCCAIPRQAYGGR